MIVGTAAVILPLYAWTKYRQFFGGYPIHDLNYRQQFVAQSRSTEPNSKPVKKIQKNNCYPSAIRTMELVKMRCRNNRAAYNWLMQELQPTFDALGMKTPEELGFYDNVEELNTA